MKPSTFIQERGNDKPIHELQNVLLRYQLVFADDIEQLKAIIDRKNPDPLTLQKINEYEVEVRIAEEAITQWKQEIFIDIERKEKH